MNAQGNNASWPSSSGPKWSLSEFNPLFPRHRSFASVFQFLLQVVCALLQFTFGCHLIVPNLCRFPGIRSHFCPANFVRFKKGPVVSKLHLLHGMQHFDSFVDKFAMGGYGPGGGDSNSGSDLHACWRRSQTRLRGTHLEIHEAAM